MMMNVRLTKKLGLIFTLGLSTLILLNSCMSIRLSSMKDDELIEAGTKEWNEKSSTDARPYWASIKDPDLQAQYLSYIDNLESLLDQVDAAAELSLDKEAPLVSAFRSIQKAYSSFPEALQLPATVKNRLRPLTVAVVKLRAADGRNAEARAFIKEAEKFLGPSDDYAPYIAAMDSYDKVSGLQKEPERILDQARAEADFHKKIDDYEAAASAYEKVELAITQEIKANKADDDSPLGLLNKKVRRKRQDSIMEKEKALRDRQYSFKERIGEEFARVPDGNKLGKMKPEDILAFNEEIRRNIEAMYKELVDFAGEYPKVISPDMIKDVENQKADLDKRIAQIAEEVRVAKDIASRGKPIMPLMIGLFNPVPGTKGADQKSRPGKFQGSVKGKADYWWGMVSIDKGQMNDLVITVNDNREVRVFSENTLSGTMIVVKKLKDLVSRGNKVGNSWPVLNAGAQLSSGKYFFELQSGRNDDYSGDVVVYSSFISRMR